MKALAHLWERVSVAAAHPMAPPVSLLVLLAVWSALGLDATNFAISIVSLFLLFILQSSQSRDTLAMQIKLDALIDASEASDELQRIDEKTADEVKELRS
jgi:low affinity Fe/Cu permease